ncbi:hypothetical protein YC2023_014303 [Brassica napus]
MRNRLSNLYLVNLFTKERINLPPVESQVGTTKLERTVVGFRITCPDGSKPGKPMHIRSPVFWIDEKTKDYLVSWGLGTCCVVYSKKGDNSIYDFSGEIPQQSFWCRCVYVERFAFDGGGPRRPHVSNRRRLVVTKLVVTVTGDVLKVEIYLRSGHSVSSKFVHQVTLNEFIPWGTSQCFWILASLCSPITMRASVETPSISMQVRTIQVISFSSISRRGRWSNYTNLIARLINSLEIDGSYQVSHRQLWHD